MHAYIIVDLGFGDAGKGLITDFLVRHLNADVVVRYNGGAQAGHNVVTPDSRHHTFSQFGAGTFLPHVRTFLSRHVVIHPQALLIEGDVLKDKGVHDPFGRLRMSDQALVITPYQQAANRIREMARGKDRHGSCGVGVGEAVEDGISDPENRILTGDFHDAAFLRQKLKAICDRKRGQIISFCKESPLEIPPADEFAIFDRKDVIDNWLASIERINELGLVVPDSTLKHWLEEAHSVVFEGAQGVLLDEDIGFHPYTTWSRSTTENAESMISEMAPDSQITKIGVTRTYAVRHGPGPLPTETDELQSVVYEHNEQNEWQGGVRYGWFDAVLTRYALNTTDGVDFLAVTHLDALPNLKVWKYSPGYEETSSFDDTDILPTIANGVLTEIAIRQMLSLEKRSQFTRALTNTSPVIEPCDPNENTVIQKMEFLTQTPVGIISRGPSAKDVQVLDSLLEIPQV